MKYGADETSNIKPALTEPEAWTFQAPGPGVARVRLFARTYYAARAQAALELRCDQFDLTLVASPFMVST